MYIRPAWFHSWILRPVIYLISNAAILFRDMLACSFWMHGVQVIDARYQPMPTFFDSVAAVLDGYGGKAIDARVKPEPTIIEIVSMGMGVSFDIIWNRIGANDVLRNLFSVSNPLAFNQVFAHPRTFLFTEKLNTALSVYGAFVFKAMESFRSVEQLNMSFHLHNAQSFYQLITAKYSERLSTLFAVYSPEATDRRISASYKNQLVTSFAITGASSQSV